MSAGNYLYPEMTSKEVEIPLIKKDEIILSQPGKLRGNSGKLYLVIDELFISFKRSRVRANIEGCFQPRSHDILHVF